MSKIPKDLVNTVEAAEHVGVHEQTVRNWRRAKKIRTYRRRNLPLVSKAEVKRYAEQVTADD